VFTKSSGCETKRAIHHTVTLVTLRALSPLNLATKLRSCGKNVKSPYHTRTCNVHHFHFLHYMTHPGFAVDMWESRIDHAFLPTSTIYVLSSQWSLCFPPPLRTKFGARCNCANGTRLSLALVTLHVRVAILFVSNLLAPELFFFILAHRVYEMWIIRESNTLELWNKLHFEEEKRKRRVYTVFKIFGTYICWINV
jgi:hypothetical protein